MAVVTISQDAEVVHLAWVEGDPLALAFTVEGVDWSGDYTAQVRATTSSDLLLELTVTATYNAPDTDFMMTAPAASNTVPGGQHPWDLQETDGVTRLSGVAKVRPQVTQ